MSETETHWGRRWEDLNKQEKRRFLTEENAYFIWQRRRAAGLPGTPEGDWKRAEEIVAFELNLHRVYGKFRWNAVAGK